MEFEFDSVKSESNKIKHGISFEEAQEMWLVPGVELKARFTNESRFLRIAQLDKKFYTSFFTVRKDHIRLISVRRSRSSEIRVYEEEIKSNEGTAQKENYGE